MKTKYFDTNLLVRFCMEDNNSQLSYINSLLEEATQKTLRVFISSLAIFELEWVLRSFYKVEKQDICDTINDILEITIIEFENIKSLKLAIQNMQNNNLGFEDNFQIAFCITNNMEFVSFDKKAIKEYTKVMN